MSVINITDLTFAYEGSYDNIFEHVSFRIDTDWKLGFTGRNGRGKTTFLNLLQGKVEYSGSNSADVDFEYFPYEVSDRSADAIDVIGGICPDYVYWELVREMNFLEIDEEVLYRPYSTLSFGEQTKLQLAAMFLRENSFLLIDEPTNHLDMHGRELLSRYLNSKKGFILVSHDRTFMDSCVDHILAINHADIEITKGNFSVWLENKERRDAFELAENEKLKSEIKRLEKTAAEKAEWSDRAEKRKIGFDPTKVEKSLTRRPTEAAKSKKSMKRAKAIEYRCSRAIEEKSALLKNIERADALKIKQEDFHADTLVQFRNVSVEFGGRKIFSSLNFTVEKGERVLLMGTNGCGKSTVMKLVCGQDIPHGGEIIIGRGLKISYVSQDASELSGSLFDFARQREIDESLLFAILRKLDFARVQFEKDMSGFSSGQKKKVLLAASLCDSAHIHIWDEPMNYIDVISRMQLEQLIIQYRPTMLFAEHDKAFCDGIADKVITF